jgi:hypothetical protein
MATQVPGGRDRGHSDVVDRWFRALDQRRVRIGLHEWLLHVTGIYADHDDVWIQIADDCSDGGSILLRVDSGTSVDHALQALARRVHLRVPSHPTVVTAAAGSARRQDGRTEVAAVH